MITATYPEEMFPFDAAMTPDLVARIQAHDELLHEAGLTRQSIDVSAWINKSVALKPS
jgi:hypothetical protein